MFVVGGLSYACQGVVVRPRTCVALLFFFHFLVSLVGCLFWAAVRVLRFSFVLMHLDVRWNAAAARCSAPGVAGPARPVVTETLG